MGFGCRIFFGAILELAPDDRRDEKGECDKQGDAKQGNDSQLHAVKKHDSHVDYREGRINEGRQCGARQEVADLVELPEAGCDLSHRTLVEVG